MSTLTATVDNTNALIGLYVEITPVTVDPGDPQYAIVERIMPDGSFVRVRGADPVNLVGTPAAAVLIDAEAPFGVPLSYRAYAVEFPAAITTSAVVMLAVPTVMWFKDPLRPWANYTADYCAQPAAVCVTPDQPISVARYGAKERAADTGLFGVLNAERPADIWARRKDWTTSITFLSRTLAAVDTIETLFTAGGPLLLQIPPIYGWPDKYFQPDTLADDTIGEDQRKPYRLWSVPLAPVDRPPPALGEQGTAAANWCAVAARYATSDELTATGQTWQQLATTGAFTPLSGYGSGIYGGPPVYGG